MFNIISAEAESVNVIVGAVYGDDKGGKKANQGLILSAWGGEYVNTKRVGRKGYRGVVKASISVIAQDDSIDTILASGASGRGLTERFLIFSEPSYLGNRDHFTVHKFNYSLYRRYENMISNIINTSETYLHLSPEAEEDLQFFKAQIEPDMKEDGIYSNALLTGLIGKADIQVRKLSSVLHCVEHWIDGGSRSNVIEKKSVLWAILLFKQLSKTFVNASDNMGYVGKRSEIDKIRQVISDSAERGKTKINFSSLRDKVKNVKPFKGSRNLSKKLREEILPILENNHYLIVDGHDIHINPRLK
jgi:hypothetical protein